MKKIEQSLSIGSSPHISSGASVEQIMRHVVYALLPIVAFSIFCYGLAALLILVTAVVCCLLTEYLLAKHYSGRSTIGDWSAVITGILFALTLPPGLPLWMVAIGATVCIALGKFMFGGLGCNVFNPALVGRAFLQAAFPSALTSWSDPFMADRFSTIPQSVLALPLLAPQYDTQSSATPLSALKFDAQTTDVNSLFLGLSNGSLGEGSALLIVLCALYLIARNFMNWRIPAGILLATILGGSLLHWWNPQQYGDAYFMLFSGGLMLGAFFMATDMVASPVTNLGCFVYGLCIGALIIIIRAWSGLPEGVMYAILFCNALSPHIDHLLQPRAFGLADSNSRKNSGPKVSSKVKI